MLLSKFGNEVLSRGPDAVLPQNLNSKWLMRIQKMADDFLDSHFQGGTCESAGFEADPVLSACVSEILRHIDGGNVDVDEEAMFQYITLYALSITMETVRREKDIGMTLPTVETIFDAERLQQIKRIKPEIEPILATLCLDEKAR
jgi:hypothetical protein